MKIKGAVNFACVCSIERTHKRTRAQTRMHTRIRAHTHTHTRKRTHAHAHTRTTARTSARTRARTQLLTGRGNGSLVSSSFITAIHLLFLMTHFLIPTFFTDCPIQCRKNVRNHLKFVVWSCEVSIDILCQLTRIDACALTLWQVFSRCRSRARFARSLASLRFAHLLAGSLRSLASLASLRSLALLRTHLLGINAGLKF